MILDSQLIKAGFKVPVQSTARRVVLCTRARDKRGKTHFALTAPGPIAVVALDTGTKEVAGKFLGQKELICSYHKITGRGDDIEKTRNTAEREWEAVKSAIIAATDHPKIRTLMDTGTEVHELVRQIGRAHV